jgi:hypothetical protein
MTPIFIGLSSAPNSPAAGADAGVVAEAGGSADVEGVGVALPHAENDTAAASVTAKASIFFTISLLFLGSHEPAWDAEMRLVIDNCVISPYARKRLCGSLLRLNQQASMHEQHISVLHIRALKAMGRVNHLTPKRVKSNTFGHISVPPIYLDTQWVIVEYHLPEG